jgi:hypothetical protein
MKLVLALFLVLFSLNSYSQRVGSKVTAQYKNGKWYGAKIIKVEKKESYEAKWKDGSGPTWVPLDWVAGPKKETLKASQVKSGMAVMVKWEGKSFYPATIGNINKGLMYQVKWDDGTKPSWVAKGKIRGAMSSAEKAKQKAKQKAGIARRNKAQAGKMAKKYAANAKEYRRVSPHCKKLTSNSACKRSNYSCKWLGNFCDSSLLP